MQLYELTDHLFDLINESDYLDIRDIAATNDRTGYQFTVSDGTVFIISCSLQTDQDQ